MKYVGLSKEDQQESYTNTRIAPIHYRTKMNFLQFITMFPDFEGHSDYKARKPTLISLMISGLMQWTNLISYDIF
ncbi:hypothetical protein SDC9_151961 [bioreactor metagenome]|uniref:Uncharacterized protein n=1 Tax=bioreactor metagenome TaxID=1076179 RepID=A0A645ETG8_9ZZZZ